MKERPILFSTPMVRAILNGTKTQTRRVIKPQPLWVGDPYVPFKTIDCNPNGIINCPYGKRGDRLWVRETFARIDDESGFGSGYTEYKATCDNPEKVIWKPSIHMPRWASRISLEITGIRVERLQDISEEDAIAEGLTQDMGMYEHKYFCTSGKICKGLTIEFDPCKCCGISARISEVGYFSVALDVNPEQIKS